MSTAAQHYNARRDVTRKERETQSGIAMRNFHNWIKAMLIDMAVSLARSDTFRVLDLACGKGGDFKKWTHHRGVKLYCGIDVAQSSVEDAANRIQSARPRCCDTALFTGSIFERDWTMHGLVHTLLRDGNDALRVFQDGSWDVASCQFALHYGCGEARNVDNLFFNLRRRSVKVLVCTFPSAGVLLQRARKHQSLEFGNALYTVSFDAEWKDAILGDDGQISLPPFGVRYTFSLRGAVDACPEYLVHVPSIVEIAQRHGYIASPNPTLFTDFASLHGGEYRALAAAIKVGPLSAEETAVSQLYTTLTFVTAYD